MQPDRPLSTTLAMSSGFNSVSLTILHMLLLTLSFSVLHITYYLLNQVNLWLKLKFLHTGTYAYIPISTHTYLKACISAHPKNGYIIAWNLILVIVHMCSILMIFPFFFYFSFLVQVFVSLVNKYHIKNTDFSLPTKLALNFTLSSCQQPTRH